MILAALILILSMAMFFFYFQATCQRILRRQFDWDYFQSIAKANRLEFPSLRKSVEEFDAPVEYSRLRRMLQCDFLALTYLLKNVQNVKRRYSNEERLLILYFRCQFLSLAVRRLLKLSDNNSILKLTSVLQYFANVVGQRVDAIKFRHFNADYLPNL
ncbi:MAG TPA: hypothetical protein VEO19_09400 [Terriglobia bacterium]|nr:hypothetical protein [Terriglobia bacterium]